MKGRYFQLYNLVDWVVYLLAIVFVFDICINFDFGWVGCKGPKVSGKEIKRNLLSKLFLVLAVACWIISGDGDLAQLAHVLPTCSLLRNFHPHVRNRKP